MKPTTFNQLQTTFKQDTKLYAYCLESLDFAGDEVDKSSLTAFNGLTSIPIYKPETDEEEKINRALTNFIESTEHLPNTGYGNADNVFLTDPLNYPLAKKLIEIGEDISGIKYDNPNYKYIVQIAKDCPTRAAHIDPSILSILLSVNGNTTETLSVQDSKNIITELKNQGVTEFKHINNDSLLCDLHLYNITSIPRGNVGIWTGYEHETKGIFHSSPSNCASYGNSLEESRKFIAVMLYRDTKATKV